MFTVFNSAQGKDSGHLNILKDFSLLYDCSETQSYVVDSIVSLLREAEPDMHTAAESALQPIMDDSMVDFQVLRDPVNSRYGVLLLKELCKPQPGLCVVCI